MDDLFKNLTIGFFAFLVVHGSLEARGKRDAEHQMNEAFGYTGQVRARVTPRGLFGLYASDLWAVDVYGKGVQTDRLPFAVTPREGWKGSIRHLRLHLRDFHLLGMPVQRFEADIPYATFDLGHALWKDRLLLRSAGTGPASAQIGASGLQSFLLRKYADTLSDVAVSFNHKKLFLTGTARLLGLTSPFSATGKLVPRAGRYIDIVDPEFRVRGLPLSPQVSASLIQRLNPILDTETDLGLKGFFTLTEVEVGESFVTIRGWITVPEK